MGRLREAVALLREIRDTLQRIEGRLRAQGRADLLREQREEG